MTKAAALVASCIALISCTGGRDSSISSSRPALASVASLRLGDVQPDSVTLKWHLTPGPAESVQVLRDGHVLAIVDASLSEYTDATTGPGARYEYEVAVVVGDVASAPAVVNTRTPVPPVNEARLQGHFDRVVITTIESTLNDSTGKPEIAEWLLRPLCKKGSCDVRLNSISGRYTARLAYLSNHTYKGLVIRRSFLECGTTPADAREEFALRVTRARVLDGVWVASELNGTIEIRNADNWNCLPGYEKSAVRARLR